ncbi:hypothetical protein CLOM_g463 [Closterium sp. NIES-68]|nr:hypothetical protein CLOM_g463 [Closterium sp. NIES-68]GJP65341.1 hypothetical protein CLOP_g22238 [Closterium sp. NIES-67]
MEAPLGCGTPHPERQMLPADSEEPPAVESTQKSPHPERQTLPAESEEPRRLPARHQEAASGPLSLESRPDFPLRLSSDCPALPPDCVDLIFRRFHRPEDVIRAALTCKAWMTSSSRAASSLSLLFNPFLLRWEPCFHETSRCSFMRPWEPASGFCAARWILDDLDFATVPWDCRPLDLTPPSPAPAQTRGPDSVSDFRDLRKAIPLNYETPQNAPLVPGPVYSASEFLDPLPSALQLLPWRPEQLTGLLKSFPRIATLQIPLSASHTTEADITSLLTDIGASLPGLRALYLQMDCVPAGGALSLSARRSEVVHPYFQQRNLRQGLTRLFHCCPLLQSLHFQGSDSALLLQDANADADAANSAAAAADADGSSGCSAMHQLAHHFSRLTDLSLPVATLPPSFPPHLTRLTSLSLAIFDWPCPSLSHSSSPFESLLSLTSLRLQIGHIRAGDYSFYSLSPLLFSGLEPSLRSLSFLLHGRSPPIPSLWDLTLLSSLHLHLPTDRTNQGHEPWGPGSSQGLSSLRHLASLEWLSYCETVPPGVVALGGSLTRLHLPWGRFDPGKVLSRLPRLRELAVRSRALIAERDDVDDEGDGSQNSSSSRWNSSSSSRAIGLSPSLLRLEVQDSGQPLPLHTMSSPTLLSLKLSGVSLAAEVPPSACLFPNLRYLELRGAYGRLGFGPRQCLGRLPSLTHFVGSARRNHNKLLLQCPNLRFLSLSEPPAAVPLVTLPQLKTLVVCGWAGNGVLLSQLSSFQSLHALRLTGLTEAPEEGGNSAGDVTCPPTLKLVQICASKAEGLPDGVRNLTSVVRLDLLSCASLAEWPQWIAQLPCLERLRVVGCGQLPAPPKELSSMVRVS